MPAKGTRAKKVLLRKEIDLQVKTQVATFLAQEKALQKIHKTKPFMESVREHIGKAIDRIDPLELAAVLGTTYLIKTGIDWSEAALANVDLVGILRFFQFPVPAEGTPETRKDEILKILSNPQAEVIEWLVSFTAAYLIVHHFGELVAAGSNILGLAKGLIGVAAVA